MSFGRLFLLFLIVPVVDLMLLVTIGERIGFWPTLATVVATALVGSWLARREGVSAWRRVQSALGGGAAPADAVLDGLVILVAGTLLLTPGFITDLVGFLGLLPPSRRVLRRVLRKRFISGIRSRAAGGFTTVSFGGRAPFSGPAAPPFGPPPIEDAEVISDRPRDAGKTA